ncbi:MAG: OmpA family protein, partial [Magnetospirillum sp. WYHS-4]
MGGASVPEEQEECEDWLVTYADTVTLVLTFFVLLLSMADFDKGKFEKTMNAMTEEMGLGAKQSDTSILKQAMQDITDTLDKGKAVELGNDEKGLVMEFASSAFFKIGSAEIQDGVTTLLTAMAETFSEERYKGFIIELEGHTDDSPIRSVHFPSNWELSTARAASVVRFLVSKGVDPRRLKATGYAETRPKVDNRNPDKTPNPEAQAINRRVLARIYPMTPEEKSRLVIKKKLPPKPEGAPAAAPPPPEAAAPAPA